MLYLLRETVRLGRTMLHALNNAINVCRRPLSEDHYKTLFALADRTYYGAHLGVTPFARSIGSSR